MAKNSVYLIGSDANKTSELGIQATVWTKTPP